MSDVSFAECFLPVKSVNRLFQRIRKPRAKFVESNFFLSNHHSDILSQGTNTLLHQVVFYKFIYFTILIRPQFICLTFAVELIDSFKLMSIS
jgi:hypothetical protein